MVMSRLLLVLMVMLVSAWGSVASAAGGFYLEGGHGYGEIDNNDTGFDTDVDVSNISAGFTLSPNAFSPSSRPSYILRVGYDRLRLTDQYDIDIDSHGIRIDNSFAWPLYKGEGARVTLGPLFRWGYYWGKSDGAVPGSAGSTAKTWVSAFGIGPELTTNIKLNDDLGLGFSVGYAFNFFLGRIKGDFPSDDYIGHRYNGYAVVSLLFL